MASPFIAPVGKVEYEIENTARTRESVDPKTDLAFYFNEYLVPKYGLNNLNVNNVASFMKELEMNWNSIDPEMKPKVLDIMVDGILSKNSSFKNDLLTKLNPEPEKPETNSKSSFGGGSSDNNKIYSIISGLIFLALIIYFIDKMGKVKQGGFSRFV
jgi:hypothetical protein